eukprot:COSAG01_NODE_2589_length_7411_cov_50.806482_8_plen_136_part_00
MSSNIEAPRPRPGLYGAQASKSPARKGRRLVDSHAAYTRAIELLDGVSAGIKAAASDLATECSDDLVLAWRRARVCALAGRGLLQIADDAAELAQEQLELTMQQAGESKRLVVGSPWSLFTSECQRFWHPPRLDK